MTTTKIRVTAEAWTSVSRSGHWTFFSSAQQEMKKAMTGLRRFSGLAACCLEMARSRSRLRCSFSFCLAALRSARVSFCSPGVSAREGAGATGSGTTGSGSTPGTSARAWVSACGSPVGRTCSP